MDLSDEYVSTTNSEDRLTIIKQLTDNRINEKMEEQIQRCNNSEAPELRILILGSVQSGKSHIGNILLGSVEFTSQLSPSPVTKCNQTVVKYRYGLRLKVTDTPAIDDLTRTNQDIAESIADVAVRNQPGPHVFLLAIPISPCNSAFKNVIRRLPEIFGDDMLKRTLVVFTHSAKLLMENITIEEFFGRDTDLNNFVKSCHGYVSIDNQIDNKCSDLLIDRINTLYLQNDEAYYDQGCFQLPAEIFEREEKIKKHQIKNLVTKVKKLEKIAERHTRAISQLTVENSDIVEQLLPLNEQLNFRRRRWQPYNKNRNK